MAQHDYDIANQSGANFRADLNNALDAIVSNNSGSSAPSTTFAYEWWIDTSNNLLKLRNSANNAWITLPLSITADNSTSGALTVNGNLTTTGSVDINGQELILDADADTSITADTDDQIDFRVGAVDVATLTNSHLVLKGTTPKITIGDGGAEDTSLIFDGNAQDYYLGLDDTDDLLKIGTGSTLGTNRAIAITSTGSVGFGSDTGDVTSDGNASRTYVGIIGNANRGVLNIGSTSSAGADGGKVSFVNGSNVVAEMSGDSDSGSTTNGALNVFTSGSLRMKIDSSGDVFVGKTGSDAGTAGVELAASGRIWLARSDTLLYLNRTGSDGDLVSFRQDGSEEGKISVSGAVVSYQGFTGSHESSGVASDTAIGTVVSTIDELDTYAQGSKEGQDRNDHAKIKISNAEGDSRVYGVLSSFDENEKPIVSSVGIGSILVTGSCAGGDLLESNGDGTAKVQDDDIIRSKTIGKVTIGNSTASVKLVSCVLYCG